MIPLTPVLLALGSAGIAQAQTVEPPDPDPLYVEHCAGCHGRHGRATFPGVMMGAGSFASPKFWEDRPSDRLVDTVTRGGAAAGLSKAMPAFADVLTPEEIERLVAVAQSFSPAPAFPAASPPAP